MCYLHFPLNDHKVGLCPMLDILVSDFEDYARNLCVLCCMQPPKDQCSQLCLHNQRCDLIALSICTCVSIACCVVTVIHR